MTDRRRRRAASSEDASREENPFAAPPEGQPDQPWQPRRGGPGTDTGRGRDGTNGSDGPADADGNGEGHGNGDGNGNGQGDGSGRDRSAWGGRWSSQQPGRQSGGFGGQGAGGSGGPEGGNGGGSGSGGPGGGLARGMRWDPTDPTQRHARYSLHTGVWALFFSLFSLPEVALLLGALSVYWGISALRAGKSPSKSGSPKSGNGAGKRTGASGGATAEDVAGSDRGAVSGGGEEERQPAAQIPVVVTPAQAAKSRRTAAISGLVTAVLALAVVAATFTFQQVYSEYFTCTEDALTQSSREDCKDLLPTELRPLLEDRSSSAAGLRMR